LEPRPYHPSDRDACLAVLDSNALPERAEFERFLDTSDGSNFTVLEHEGAIAGCGGFTIRDGAATLLHGMIRSDVQRMGLGRFLLMYRLRQISKSGAAVQFVRAAVPPKWAPFYQKQGFKLRQPASGGTIELIMKLTVCP
jgi:N-acetylglutamate synthase-like GNAT family acetyltransferase